MAAVGGARESERIASRPGAKAIGWVFAAASVGWAIAVHHGLGPKADPATLQWYEPTGFFLRSDLVDALIESVPLAFLAFTLPAAALAAGVFLTTRSAVARASSLICVAATFLFIFYGVVSPYPWEFFGWRGSAALWGTAACVGCSAASPLLAASWLRLPRWLQAATYLPVAIAVVALIRNATGTDGALRYSLSPWPAIPVFGIEVGGLFVAAALIGIAVASGAYAGEDARGRVRALRVALGLLLPLGIIALGAAAGLFPFKLGVKTLSGVAALCGVSVALVVARGGGDAVRIRRRARALATGAALVAFPMLVGQVVARIDYHVTREWRARSIIEALDRYVARETLYPDALSELVEAGDIAAIPAPAIGFRFLDDTAFRYQSFGSSFILEFEAPRWVECAYTPPYADEESGEAASEPELAESWSCPSEPPELW